MDHVNPTVNSEVSTIIGSGDGYDGWTGSVRRKVVDIKVAGSIGSQPLSLIRTYSSRHNTWAWSYNWGLFGRPYASPDKPFYATTPDGRTIYFGHRQVTGDPAYHATPGTKERLIMHDDGQINGYSQTGTADLFLEDGSIVHFTRLTDWDDGPGHPAIFVDTFIARYIQDPFGQRVTFTYQQIPGTFNPWQIRLTQVNDPAVNAPRFLTYAYETGTGYLHQVTASDGQTVTYTWQNGTTTSPPRLLGASYSDGTSATYTYNSQVHVHDYDVGGDGYVTELETAQDTRVEGAMRSVQYQYPNPTNAEYGGQVLYEKHYPGGEIVSTFASPGDRTNPSETRGDGSICSLGFEYFNLTPLMLWKSDYKGVKEYFEYEDDSKYLKKFTDRRGNVTVYTNEPIVGNPKRITYGTAANSPHIDYTYSNNGAPYYIATITDELGRLTRYTRDGLSQITRIDYPDGAYETYEYNGYGQVITHRRKNGAFDYVDYANGLLYRIWEQQPARRDLIRPPQRFQKLPTLTIQLVTRGPSA